MTLDRACAAGRALACSAWAKMSEDGQGVNLTPTRTETLLNMGCDRGDVNACLRAARYALERAESADQESSKAEAESRRAHTLFQRACDEGEVNACLELGLSAKTGRAHYPKDLQASARWLNQACTGDVGAACYEVARLQAPDSQLSDPIRARQNMNKACNLGTGAACAYLGQVYEQGLGVAPNVARARELHELACELEQPASCLALGELTLATNPVAALTWLGKACGAGIGAACLQEGKLLEGRVLGVETNPEAALQRYQSACQTNSAEACGYAGLLKLKLAEDESRLGRDEQTEVVAWLDRGCNEARLDEACLVFGSWLAQGRAGLKQNGTRAALLLGPLCNRAEAEPQFAPACQRLGRLSETGAGVERNVAGAATFYSKGCTAGHGPACLSHATLLWKGPGGYKRDPEKAVTVFRRHCAQKNELACLNLGYAQQVGLGTARNLTEAKGHFERTCQQGIQAGCAYLGQYYITSSGSERNREKGQQLLRSACDSANGEGCLFQAKLHPASPTHKQELLQRACLLDVTEACLTLESGR